MLLTDILDRLSIPNRESRFSTPPAGDYLVWQDNLERGGADLKNCMSDHSVMFELYTPKPNDELEKEIGEILDSFCVAWEKGDRTWLETERLYMTPFYFDYLEKE